MYAIINETILHQGMSKIALFNTDNDNLPKL